MSLARVVTRATFTPGAELELEAGHGRPDGEADEVGLDPVGGEGALEDPAALFDHLAGRAPVPCSFSRASEGEASRSRRWDRPAG